MSFLDTLLGRKHAPMIGLDISSSSAKLVELGQTSNGEYILERFASEPFEKGWITDGGIFVAEHQEANVRQREDAKDTSLVYGSFSANTLRKAAGRAVTVSPAGDLHDAGFRP